MFDKKSKLFVSDASHSNSYVTFEEALKNFEKNQEFYTLSFHSGFRKFDYSKILEIKEIDPSCMMLKMVFKNVLNTMFELVIPEDGRIYSTTKGWVYASKFSTITDVALDIEGRLCKLVDKKHLGIGTDKTYDISVAFNKSLVVDGILVKCN